MLSFSLTFKTMAICRLTVLSKSVTTLLLDKIIEASFTTSQKVHWQSWKSEPEINKHAIFFTEAA